jgi:pyruvate dehydrogenase E2 component (dihydrolipoamide acetyltransferase)
VARIIVPENSTVEVGSVLAVIAEPGENLDAYPIAAASVSKPEPTLRAEKTDATPGASFPSRVQIEPRARRLAKKLGVDIESIKGTGPRGRIRVEDVERAQKPVPGPPSGDWLPLSGRRKIIAERMLGTSRDTASLTLTTEADVTAMAVLRNGLRDRGVRPLHIIIKAAADALRQHPAMNAHIKDGQVRILKDIHIGVAVDVEEGLMVPVLRNADQKSVLAISKEVTSLAEKTKTGTLNVEEATGSSFTVSNLGALDIEIFTPILNPPEIGILGVGRLTEKPSVDQGQIVVRSKLWLSLTFDHCVVDGAPAAGFLRSIKNRLEDLAWLII